MKLISDQVLKNTVINIDDYSFEDCTFIRCTLVFSGRTFEMPNCRIVDCRIRLLGEAARITRLLMQFSMEPKAIEKEQTTVPKWVH